MNRQRKDMDLINKAKAGYQEAYTELFNYHYRSIFTLTYSILKDYHDAEDQAMITFEKAFKNIDKYQPFFKFSTWLAKIARTTAIDYIRFQRKRFYNDLELSKIYHLKNEIENPEQIIINRENLTILKAKINNLSDKRRETVIMRTMGMKCREIAAETGVGIDAITGQLYKIRQKLAV